MTLKEIMDTKEKQVQDNFPISSSDWVDSALQVNALKGDIDNLIAMYEGCMADLECLKVAEDITPPKAKILCKMAKIEYSGKEINYTEYLKLKAYQKRVAKFISLAESRARIR